ncbi:unnamed protein product [Spirodela intermedia]|uniref:Uncharacterized protein n=2 Tax=Spirodela intermedia TaxID=51605 RepID=A0A7I8JI62_SPIIN|nr:unnamed protein product [Spirodela intermedia]CAA6669847.1 unnamed protein product [Spirodela intermedia]CAA7406821.1 unnamed protein product [Spirodela intermedia]
MAKSLRSKMQRRLRTLRRDLAQPFYDKKETSKLAAQQAALAAPKLPVRVPKKGEDEGVGMGSEVVASPATASTNTMDVEMADAGSSKTRMFLKPGGGVGKKSKKKQKGKRGKGKYKRNHQY